MILPPAGSDDRGDLSSVLLPSRYHLSHARSEVEGSDGDAVVADGSAGFVHSFEVVSMADGPGTRFVLFTSGCLLRCLYCHNPDTWHLKHGVRVGVKRVMREVGKYAKTLRMLDGGLTITGGEPLVQSRFTYRVFRAAKERFGLHTCLDTSGYLGARADEDYLRWVDLVLLDLKSWDRDLYRRLTGVELEPTLDFALRLADLGKPVWVRFVLVPGLTDGEENVAWLARFCGGLGNVQRVDVLPFHQMGQYKWRELGLTYQLADTRPPSAELLDRVKEQFRAKGLKAP